MKVAYKTLVSVRVSRADFLSRDVYPSMGHLLPSDMPAVTALWWSPAMPLIDETGRKGAGCGYRSFEL
jgi:hypothetical protein